MESYHLRRNEKNIEQKTDLENVIRGQKIMTLALCRDNEPYLVTMNYGYDRDANCLYFHCAAEGKKMDFLADNPVVWGQIFEDVGYLPGECDHAFRCVEFRGQVDFLTDLDGKCNALAMMIDQLEPDPEPVKSRLLTEKRLNGVMVGRIKIENMTGKQNKG